MNRPDRRRHHEDVRGDGVANNAVTICAASTYRLRAASVRLANSARSGARSRPCEATLPIILPVGATAVDTTATLLSGSSPPRFAGVADASGSNAATHRYRAGGLGSPERHGRDHRAGLLRQTVWSAVLASTPAILRRRRQHRS
jgi:hypothetical protein